MASSFKKKGSSKFSHPRGTRPSLHNAQLLVSTGVPSLDSLLGGGLAVGTVLLIEEDTFSSYSRLLLKYFLSEGIMCGHSLVLASASEPPDDILKDLPGPADEKVVEATSLVQQQEGGGRLGEQSDPEQMKIAWRYQNMPKVQSSFSNRFGHFFDLTSSMSCSRVQAIEKTLFDAAKSPGSSSSELYCDLRSTIKETISSGHFSVDEPVSQQRNILRVALHSLGSPLWLDDGDAPSTPHTTSPSTPHTTPTLTQFLHSLRALMRRAYAVAMVTIPAHLYQDTAYVKHLERLCDAAVRLESFAGSDKEQNPLYKDYHGLFHVKKLPCLNSLCPHLPETLDLAFKLRRKKFSIEKLHLPPELSETASRPQEDVVTKQSGSHAQRAHMAIGTRQATSSKPLSKHNIDF